MEILQTAAGLQSRTEMWRRAGLRIGLVPTMGALHEGHLQLVRAAARENDVVVVSIFVNPTQFNNPEDFRLYPRLPEADADMLAGTGCTALFEPSVEEMYPQPTVLRFDFGTLERVMEGAHRPGHFNGVATVVSKLFHLSRPHRAYFGQKDLQQVAVVRQLVHDLSFDLELVVYPTVRERDGLAMSSRNRRLPLAARAVAPQLYRTLELARQRLQEHLPVAEVMVQATALLQEQPTIELEYLDISDARTLQPLPPEQPATGPVAVCLAVWLAGVRLIDNIVLEV